MSGSESLGDAGRRHTLDDVEAELARLEAESREREAALMALADELPAAVSRRRVVVETLRSLRPRRPGRDT